MKPTPSPPAGANEGVPWPRSIVGTNHKITLKASAYYVDIERRESERVHTHLFEEYGLIDHERCRLCGVCRLRHIRSGK